MIVVLQRHVGVLTIAENLGEQEIILGLSAGLGLLFEKIHQPARFLPGADSSVSRHKAVKVDNVVAMVAAAQTVEPVPSRIVFREEPRFRATRRLTARLWLSM